MHKHRVYMWSVNEFTATLLYKEDTGMETIRTWVGCIFKFLCSQLHNVCGTADITYVLNFTPHFANQVGRKLSYCNSYPFGKFRQNGSQRRCVNSIPNVPWRGGKKTSRVRSGERDGHVMGSPLPIHFPGKWRSKKLLNSWWKWLNCMSLGPSP
jgi:hypothetical protein